MTTLENQTSLRPARAMPRAAFQNFLINHPRTLEQAVHKVVCSIEAEALQALANDDRTLTQSRSLLTLMTFCYARQLYASTDLSDIARREEDLRRFNPEGLLHPQAIRRFRAENRAVVQRCLVAALHFLVEQKISLGVLTKVSDAQLAEEANRRIIMATFLDSVELDGEQVQDPPVELCLAAFQR